MPKNYFMNREKRSTDPSKVSNGDYVFIVAKEDQGIKDFNKLYFGKINQTLSNGCGYKNGFKVNLQVIDKGKFDFYKYYKECILNFNNPENIPKEKVDELWDYLRDAKPTGQFVIGRIQYIAFPEGYKPKPLITTLKLGLANNQLCDLNTLQQQIQYIKSSYYIKASDYKEILDKLIKYRTLILTLDTDMLKSMNISPNYCEITIENNKDVVSVKYTEIK